MAIRAWDQLHYGHQRGHQFLRGRLLPGSRGLDVSYDMAVSYSRALSVGVSYSVATSMGSAPV